MAIDLSSGVVMPCFVDSFDHYDSAHLPAKWDYVYNGGENPWEIAAGAGRNGTQGWRNMNAGGISMQFVLSQGQVVMGVAFQPARLPFPGSPWTIFVTINGPEATVLTDLRLNADGTIEMTANGGALPGGRSTRTLSTGFFYYIEMRVSFNDRGVAANTCSVNVNGEEWITLTAGAHTAPPGFASCTIVALGRHNIASVQSAVGVYDDFYLGAGVSTFLGDIMIVPLYTTGNGAQNDFAPLASTNFSQVHEHPPDDDVSYNSSATAGAIELYTYDQIAGTPTIFGVQLNNLQRKSGASIYLVHSIIVSGGTTAQSTFTYTPGTQYQNQFFMLDNDPHTGTSWTAAGVNALQAGTKLVSVV